MEKIVTLNNQIVSAIRSISLTNNTSDFSFKITKELLSKWIRRIIIAAFTIGYVGITILSYSVSPVYFWTLVKSGTILSLLFIIALSKN